MNKKKEDIEFLKDFVLDIECLDVLDKFTSKVNFFDVTGISHFEIRHSKFLSWLMNPRENHGLHDYFLRKLLQKMLNTYGHEKIDVFRLDSLDLSDMEIYTEYKNIDILALSKTNKIVFAIENKYYSTEHDEQLKRYQNILETNYKDYIKVYAYLTIDGDEPEKDDDWKVLSYSDILELLDRILNNKELNQHTKLIIEDYTDILRRELNMDDELNKICLEIYNNHKKAIDLIIQNIPDDITNTANAYKEVLKELEASNDIISLKSTNAFFRFTTPKIREVVGTIGKDTWLPTKDLFAFEVCVCRSKAWRGIILYLQMGPGEDEDRQKYFEALSRGGLSSKSKNLPSSYCSFERQGLYNPDDESKSSLSLEELKILFKESVLTLIKKVNKVMEEI